MSKRILITGSRTWTDAKMIRMALADFWAPDAILVSGACPRGADALCEACWQAWSGQIERHPARWTELGRRAGPARNAKMVRLGADVCLAFIDENSVGAVQCAKAATLADIPTWIFRPTSKGATE
jgi:YspA, cpYpsA-related SLOG family